MAKIALRFYLDDQRDAELMAWLDGQANRSEAIRQALRILMGTGAGARGCGLSVDTLRQVLREELSWIGVDARRASAPGLEREDADLREAMDNLLSTWSFEQEGRQGDRSDC